MNSNGINVNTPGFVGLCKTHKVKALYALCSVINGNFTKKSDIDLLIDIEEQDPLTRGELLLSIWDKFELYFKRNVDLLTPASLSNPYLKETVDQTKILIYDGSKGKVLIFNHIK